MSPKNSKATKHLLVTGVPKFAAIKLIQRVLQTERKTKIHALVMEKFAPLAKTLLRRLTPAQRKRVVFYIGDVTAIDLGLSGEEYLKLTETITHIHHIGLIWEYRVPKATCRKVNINGTKNILAFAEECHHLERLAYYSTLYVSGERKGVIMEEECDLGQSFKNAFESTRFQAEKLVREAMEKKNLRATIFRLGNVVCDSQNGEILNFEGPYIFLKLLLTVDRNLPFFLPGACEAPTNLVPVDYVTRAVTHLLSKPSSLGKTYHITDPYPLSFRTVFETLSMYIGRRAPTTGVPSVFYRAVLLIPGMAKLAGVPSPLFGYFNHKAIHNCQNAINDLKDANISCPRFESYFPVGVEYARDLLKRQDEKREEEETVDPFDKAYL